MMRFLDVDEKDRKLVEAAIEVIRNNYHPVRHTVGAAVLCSSGKIYTGINIEACGYGPCAEPIALGTAFARGEKAILEMVAVTRVKKKWIALSPCGNCRQLLLDYAPQAYVIVKKGRKMVKAKISEFLPAAYRSQFDAD